MGRDRSKACQSLEDDKDLNQSCELARMAGQSIKVLTYVLRKPLGSLT